MSSCMQFGAEKQRIVETIKMKVHDFFSPFTDNKNTMFLVYKKNNKTSNA